MAKQSAKENYSDLFRSIILEVRKRLPNGNDKFPDIGDSYPIAINCLKYFPASDSTVPNDPPTDFEIHYANEFWEEINTIILILNEIKINIDLCPWLKDKKSNEQCSKQALAIQIWEKFANPFRWRGDRIYVIHPPRDYLIGVPHIKEFEVNNYLTASVWAFAGYSKESSSNAQKIDLLKRKYSYSLIAVLILIICVTSSFLHIIM